MGAVFRSRHKQGRDAGSAEWAMPVSKRNKHPLKRTGALPPAQTGPWFMVICAPDHSSKTYSLRPGQAYTLGRDPLSDIVLDYPWVSNQHAAISGGEHPEIVDLGSLNGTQVGSRQLTPGKAVPLTAGAVISIGTVAILVRRGEARDADAWRRAPPLPFEPELTSPASARAQRALPHGTPTAPVVSSDPKMQDLYGFVRQVAQSNVNVLILGETGAGKELLARAVHESSPRSRGPLVTLNCAAVPHGLFESELFGYERGAFSGAISAKPGLFEAAHAATIFLDEVAELPISVQPKLLRVLETGEVPRLGAVRPVHVDVRVIAATNRDIRAEVASGSFRADLFYRLNGITLSLPPLRERPLDIAPLARHFAAEATRNPEPDVTDAAIELLERYAWPGNVRELRSVIERAALLARGEAIDTKHLLLEPATQRPAAAAPFESGAFPVASAQLANSEIPTETVLAELARRERQRIEEALERTAGNQKDAAKLLGISRRTLIRRLERYQVARPRKRADGPVES